MRHQAMTIDSANHNRGRNGNLSLVSGSRMSRSLKSDQYYHPPSYLPGASNNSRNLLIYEEVRPHRTGPIGGELAPDQSTTNTEATPSPQPSRSNVTGVNVSDDPASELLLKQKKLQKRVTCSKGAIAVLVFVLVCVSIVFSALLWQYVINKRGQEQKPKSRRPLPINQNDITSDGRVCLTSDCVTASAAIIESLDTSVDPCEDFYGFVCNGWIDKNSIPKGQPSWSVTDQISENNLELLRSLLETPLDQRASKAEQKAQVLYHSCLDSSNRIEALGAEPLKDIIRAVGGWSFSGDHNENLNDFDLKAKLLAVQKFNTKALFQWYVRDGMNDTSQYELFVNQGGLTLPSKVYYERDDKGKAAMFKYISSIISLLGEEKGKHAQDIHRLIEFESILANISSRDDSISGWFVPMDRLDDWIVLTPSWGRWKDFFNEVINVSIGREDDNDIFYFTGKENIWIQYGYLTKLSAILSDHFDLSGVVRSDSADLSQEMRAKLDARDDFIKALNNYLTWRAILPYISYLSKDFQRAEKMFVKTFHGTQGREERWRTCVINTDLAMGFAIGPAFVKASFSETSRTRAHEMMSSIKEAFKDRLEELDWITPVTLQKIRQKINNTSELFGYPDFMLDTKKLDKAYQGFKVSEREFFKNQVRFHRFALAKNLRLLGTDIDKGFWPFNFPPSTVNAFYMYSRNQIVFPAGVLQPPLFSENQPMSLNFGHVGTFMGHEILHGFDDTGRLYGPQGQKLEWWPNVTSHTFLDKTRCFIKQYNQEIFSGRYVDGKRTLSENIADNGGLVAAYEGYKSWFRQNVKQELNDSSQDLGLLPGLQYTHEQLVFLGYARAHCSSTREKAMDLRLLTDPHSPPHVRVNTALANLEDFAKVWQCPIGSNLNPTKRCSLW